MDVIHYSGLKKSLIHCILAFVVIAGFFSGYTGNETSPIKSKTQTEWIARKQPQKKVRSVFEKGNKVISVHGTFILNNEFYNLQSQNRRSHISYAVNQKLVESIILSTKLIHHTYRLQPAEEDSISA